MRRALFALCALVGCRIESVDGAAYVGPRNHCEIGCPEGAVCSDGACVANETHYPLILEVTPPSSGYAAGVTFRIAVDDRKGGTRDLELPETARVVAKLDAGGSVPLTLRLERTDAVPGAPASVFEARSTSPTLRTTPLVVPPGDYYVWVSPTADRDLVTIPPVQLRDDTTGKPWIATFPPGSHELQISYASSLRSFEIALTDDAGKPLKAANEARDLYVFDETSGKLASTIAHTCVEPGKDLTDTVKLTLAPALDGHRYTLRVAPAASPCSAATPRVRATIDFDYDALDVIGRGGKATIAIPKTSTVIASGTVVAFGTKPPRPIDGTIVLRSVDLDKSIDAKAGHAWVVVQATVSGGAFSTVALPGNYRADIIPADGPNANVTSNAAAVCVDCTVPSQDPTAIPGERTVDFRIDATPQALDFEIARRVQMTASVTGFDGSLFTVGTFDASSATSIVGTSSTGASLLTRALTGSIAVVQEKSTGRTWNVAAPLDPGFYDLVVRTPDASGYPWIVRPRLEVKPAPSLDVGKLESSAPVVFAGRVLDPSGVPFGGATIRARALITSSDPKKPALGAVLVGETRADVNGGYRLVVPSALSGPAPTTLK